MNESVSSEKTFRLDAVTQQWPNLSLINTWIFKYLVSAWITVGAENFHVPKKNPPDKMH